MKEEQDIGRISYISELNEILKKLRDIPQENVIERATFEGRLNKIVQEYREKYFPLSIVWFSSGLMDDETEIDCCDVCSNEKVACTCMGEYGMD